jgi:hypothetical protein
VCVCVGGGEQRVCDSRCVCKVEVKAGEGTAVQNKQESHPTCRHEGTHLHCCLVEKHWCRHTHSWNTHIPPPTPTQALLTCTTYMLPLIDTRSVRSVAPTPRRRTMFLQAQHEAHTSAHTTAATKQHSVQKQASIRIDNSEIIKQVQPHVMHTPAALPAPSHQPQRAHQ